jgi:hypothetical protein
MHRRLAVGTLCLVLIATATVLPWLAPTASAVTSCTGWKDSYAPPTTIRVLRSYGSASGTVQTVDFRAYVNNVMAWEWPSTYPTASLRAGAIAVKQYGWYFTMHYRGGTSASGACYDVKDTTSDQIYRPETRSASSTHLAAVSATWGMTIRRTKDGVVGTFILTGYRSGSITSCGAEKTGYLLYAKGVYDCGRQGKTLEEIERIYYGSTLQPTDPGAHQIVGSVPGDVVAIVPAKSGVDAFVRTSTGTAFTASPSAFHIDIADASTLSRVSADATGDGLDDLLMLVADGPSAQHIALFPATGSGYAGPLTWWASASAGTTFASMVGGAAGVQLLAGDFDGDTISDVALVVTGTDPTLATIYRLRSTKSGLDPLLSIYSGLLNPANTRFYAADTTGDGRADIVTETDNGPTGLSYNVLASGPTGLLAAPAAVPWFTGASLLRTTTLTTVTDFDRDGRDDLVLAVSKPTGFDLLGLRSTSALFTLSTLGTSTLAFNRIKLGAGDFNGDGRGDVVVLASLDAGAIGTRLTTYLSNGTVLTGANWLDDTKLSWKTLQPY